MAIARERVRHALSVRRVEVAGTREVAPGMLRITVAGEELAGFASDGPADHVKLFLPDAEGRLIAPSNGPGDTIAPSPDGPGISRDYTPAAFRPAPGGGELDLDFFLHEGGGPAMDWARSARPGSRLAIAGPRGSLLPPTGADRVVLVGDETAFPAIARWLDAIEESVLVTCLLTAGDPGIRSYLDGRIDRASEARWFEPGEGAALEEALRGIAFTESTFAFLAGDADALVPLRRHLRRELGLAREQVQASGYWRAGVVALDHHAPVDPSDPD